MSEDKHTKYVIVTPAKDEEGYIENTLKSMVAQTITPMRWVIVNDGSTDRTGEIALEYSKSYDWIEVVSRPKKTERDFAAKVKAFNVGYERVASLDFQFVGNVDADISFDPDHFEFLLGKFRENPKLGLAGTRLIEAGHDSFKDAYYNDEDVAGPCQLFRREVFESIGGYQPVRLGGIDWAAVRRTRMAGWQTVAFPDKTLFHHRPFGTARAGLLKSRFEYGRRERRFGNHPLWQLFRVAYQMTRRPYFIGGLLIGLGYFWALIRGEKTVVPPDLAAFHRKEQMRKLKDALLRKLGRRTATEPGRLAAGGASPQGAGQPIDN